MTRIHNFDKNVLSRMLWAAIVLAAVLVFPLVRARPAEAQAPGDPAWETPVNLSNSGSTSNPVMVADSTGILHVIWQDEFTGGMYSYFADGQWSPAAAVEFPFGEYTPVLVAGSSYVYAFWIDTERDNRLLVSRTANESFGTAWESPRNLSAFVANFSVEFQNPGGLHFAYIFTGEDADRSAGVYYQRSEDEGATFTPPVSIYQSRYLRSAKPDKSNIQIASASQGDNVSIYVSWDDRDLKRIFLSKSVDLGVTWQEPFEVEGPTASQSVVDPFNLVVSVSANKVVLVWQSNLQSGLTCTQYYQSSVDGGKTWSPRQIMLGQFVGCAQENRFLRVSNQLTLLQTIFDDRVYLIAWDGSNFSEPQTQGMLYGFNDPDTNQSVSFRCRRSAITDNRLYVVGCDEVGTRDIWVLSREIGPVTSWFPPPSIWNSPQLVFENSHLIRSPQGLIDADGRYHIFWISRNPDSDEDSPESLYYTVWSQGVFAIPAEILASSGRNFDRLSVGLDRSKNRLILTWNDHVTGEIFFSWADISRAGSVFEWATPVQVPAPVALGSSPFILPGLDGVIYICYSIPINEGRGIYLVSSGDGGNTWSEPVRVFDAAQANWQIAENPRLYQAGDGSLHILYSQVGISRGSDLIGDYYSRSLDNGKTWSELQLVVAKPSQPGWLSGQGEQQIFRFWLTPNGGQNNLIQEISRDGGATWSAAVNLTKLGETPGQVALAVGSTGELNLAQIVEKSGGGVVLTQQRWNGEDWSETESALLEGIQIQSVTSLSAGLGPQGELVAVYPLTETDALESDEQYRLNLISQKAAAQAVSPTPTSPAMTSEAESPAVTPTLPPDQAITQIPSSPTATPVAPPELTETPTRALTPVPNTQAPGASPGPILGLIVGGTLSVVVVAVFLFITFQKNRRD